jgi:hypothetical protein
MVEECHTGANVLLAYWHYCNKGSKPFAPGSNTADFHAMSELKPYQTAFVKETSNYVQANGILVHHTLTHHVSVSDYYSKFLEIAAAKAGL